VIGRRKRKLSPSFLVLEKQTLRFGEGGLEKKEESLKGMRPLF